VGGLIALIASGGIRAVPSVAAIAWTPPEL